MRKFFTLNDPVLPVHVPRLLVETAAALGADRQALLEDTEVTAAQLDRSDSRISYAQLSVLEQNALRLTGDPALGLRFGRATQITHTGIVGLAAISSSNLRGAFDIYSQFVALLNPAWELSRREDGGRSFVTMRPTLERGELLRFATEAMIAGTCAMARQALGHDLALRAVRLNYARPAHYRLYTEYIGKAAYLFDQPVAEIELDASVFDAPVATADPATATLAANYCATEISLASPVEGLSAEVRRVLVERGLRRTGIEEVARALQTSPRSLRRALSQMGTSYQQLEAEVLRTHAENLVRSGQYKLEHLARELGFADARSFRRAFKRWTGRNPNELRRSGGS